MDDKFNWEDELFVRWVGSSLNNFKIRGPAIGKLKSSGCKKFVSIPFNKCLFNRSNKIVKKYNLSLKLAPKSMNKNGRFVFF